MSIHLRQLVVLTEVPMTSRLYWIRLYEGSNKWKSFFQVDPSPAIVYCARMLGESEHTYITGHVALSTRELTVLSILFTFDSLVLFSLLLPLLCMFLCYLTDRYFPVLPDFPTMVWYTLGCMIPGLTVTMIWLEICD